MRLSRPGSGASRWVAAAEEAKEEVVVTVWHEEGLVEWVAKRVSATAGGGLEASLPKAAQG